MTNSYESQPELGQSQELAPNKDHADSVRQLNQTISELIRRARSQNDVSSEEVTEIDEIYNNLDEQLSDLAFGSPAIAELYNAFHKIVPGRIQRLKELVPSKAQVAEHEITQTSNIPEQTKGLEERQSNMSFSLETGEIFVDSAPIYKFNDPAKKILFGQLTSLAEIFSAAEFVETLDWKLSRPYSQEEKQRRVDQISATTKAIEDLDRDLTAALGSNTFFRIEKEYADLRIINLSTVKTLLKFESNNEFAVIRGWASGEQTRLTPGITRTLKYLLDKQGEWVGEDELIKYTQQFMPEGKTASRASLGKLIQPVGNLVPVPYGRILIEEKGIDKKSYRINTTKFLFR